MRLLVCFVLAVPAMNSIKMDEDEHVEMLANEIFTQMIWSIRKNNELIKNKQIKGQTSFSSHVEANWCLKLNKFTNGTHVRKLTRDKASDNCETSSESRYASFLPVRLNFNWQPVLASFKKIFR